MSKVYDRLADVLEAIGRIEAEAKFGRVAFDADPKVQVWMIHHIQVIGEAIRAISGELKEIEPNYPWSQIVGMRHILVHDYFGIDLNEVWQAVERDLPELKQVVSRIVSRA